MNEARWLVCPFPEELVGFLGSKLGERKRRLFHCAALRSVWPLLTDPRSRHAVEVAERFADGHATPQELAEAGVAAEDAWRRWYGPAFWTDLLAIPYLSGRVSGRFFAGQSAAQVTAETAQAATWAVYYGCAKALEVAAGWHASLINGVTRRTEMARQATLLRDLVGNPFRLVTVDAAWGKWHDATILKLALAAYDERHLPSGHLDPAHLAVLADALEEAGCTDPEVLGHLRGPGPHVRGCWVLDQLTGRQ